MCLRTLIPLLQSSSTYHTPLKTRLGLESSEQKRVAKRKSKKGDSDVGKSPVSCFSSDTLQGSSRCLLRNPVFFDGVVDSNPSPLRIDEPEIFKADDLDNFNGDRLIVNTPQSMFHLLLLSWKRSNPVYEGFLDYKPVLSPDNPFSEPTKASPTATRSPLEDKYVSFPDFNILSSSSTTTTAEDKFPFWPEITHK